MGEKQHARSGNFMKSSYCILMDVILIKMMQVKSQCTSTPAHSLKTYMREQICLSTCTIGARWKYVLRHVPDALTAGMNAGVHRIGGWVSPTVRRDEFEKRKILCSCQDSNSESSRPQPFRCTDCATRSQHNLFEANIV
jgi:hypothetical protein